MSWRSDRLKKVSKPFGEYEFEPQLSLQRSNHPYAPFSGDAYEWGSYVFDDASTYEGLTRNSIPHGKGVFIMGKMRGGAGITLKGVKMGDKYEGEMYAGYAHGMGMYTTSDGIVFKGQYTAGQKDGCGAMYDLKPWKDRISAGVDPRKAWRQARKEIFQGVQYGTWRNNTFVSGPTDLGLFCSLGDIEHAIVSTDVAVAGARMFEFKPEGQATLHKTMLQDSEAPAPLMQHPLHYPHGTLFMAPGPAGQTVGIPQSASLKKMMLRQAKNYMAIHDVYNFDYVPASDSIMAKAIKLDKRDQKIKDREEALEKRRIERRMKKIKSEEPGAAKGYDPLPEVLSKEDEDDDDGGDDGDLLADASRVVRQLDAREAATASRGIGPTAFGSITLSMSRAQHGLGNFFENIAKRAPRMPRLGPPRQ